MKVKTSLKGLLFAISTIMAGTYGLLVPMTARAAACTLPATDYGSVTVSLSVPATATYRLWTRMMVPDGANTTYLLEVDGANCYNVGGGTFTSSSWTWVDYQDGATTSKVQQQLTQGTHSLKLIGNKAGVALDRLEAVSDLSCVPTGLGDNCNTPTDTTPPTVTMTAPADAASVSSIVNVAATANDNVAVTKVEFYDNSTLVKTLTTAPYSVSWDTTMVPNGSHLLTVRAYDAAGNIGSDSHTVMVQNGDQLSPTVPQSVTATANAYNKVTVSWGASTDNVAVTGYNIVRDGTSIGTSTTLSYADNTVAPSSNYSYQVQAYDAAANNSALSNAAAVMTPGVPDTTAPSVPVGLTATAASSSQINLSWQPSTDNIGVTGYDVYRGSTKLATVTSTSFGDTGLSTNTSYTYTVKARDAAGNVSIASASASATTMQAQAATTIKGKITASGTGLPLSNAKVTVYIGTRNKKTFSTGTSGTYVITLPAGGRYSVTYSKRGYFSQSLSVLITQGAATTQDVALVKQ